MVFSFTAGTAQINIWPFAFSDPEWRFFFQNFKFSNLQIISNHKMVCNLQSVSNVHGCIKRIYYEIERKTTEKTN